MGLLSRRVMSKDRAPPSPLDDWIDEEGVAAAIEEARRQIEDGSTPGFTDMGS